MIDRIVAREMREHLTGSCIVACHGSTASPEKTKLRSSAWEVVVPRCVSSECWSKGSTGKAWRHTSEVSLGTVAGGWEWKPSLHLRKNNHQRNFYCRFSSSGHDADGYAKTWEILQCLVCPGAKRQKTNWKQAQHLVNDIRLGSAALLRGQWLESAQNAGYKMRCGQVWAAALHADPASSTVERNFKAALAIYSRTSLAALISPDLPIELGHDS